ncbi:MAG: hypothetical protein K0Q94_5254, partial [Paenibacillus sp.]|nr:hypothetical protein [Paenibacillus sp.]
DLTFHGKVEAEVLILKQNRSLGGAQ